MRIKLKGLNRVAKTLSNGEKQTYYYAWKGGPRLPGKPGEEKFMAAYYDAVSRKVEPKAGTLQAILTGFQQSSNWDDLAPRTQKDYVRLIKLIEQKFGTFPISALSDRRTRALFMEWRDERAKASRRQADYGWQVLARILSWAHGRGLTPANPCEKGGRLYRSSRSEIIWTEDDEKAFINSAPPHLHLPLTLALWTGQRQGDLLALTWPQYDGERLRIRQGKTGARVIIPAGPTLQAALNPYRQKIGHVLLNSEGKPWTSDGFRSSWRKACAKAGVVGVTFNDLRGTAVTRLALVGCTEPEIATISGHSLQQVRSILDSHYLKRDQKLAESAIRKLEAGTNFPNRTSN